MRNRSNLGVIAMVLTLLTLTAGCTLGGAAAGGVIGNEATNHSTVGTVGGAVAGGVIGHELGK
jgi:osmotically inducible lipoprotein OsmB